MGLSARAQPRQKGLETAERVRKTALRLFAAFGYAAVSMRDIASQVGVQPGALYNHFPTKQDILKDLMLTHMDDLMAAWDRAEFPDGTDPIERFVRFHIRYHLERADEVFIAYMELRSLDPDNFETIETERRRYENILTGILTEGAASGRYQVDDARVATRAIIAMLTGIPAWFRTGGGLSKAEIETLYLKMVRKTIALETGEISVNGDRMT